MYCGYRLRRLWPASSPSTALATFSATTTSATTAASTTSTTRGAAGAPVATADATTAVAAVPAVGSLHLFQYMRVVEGLQWRLRRRAQLLRGHLLLLGHGL